MKDPLDDYVPKIDDYVPKMAREGNDKIFILLDKGSIKITQKYRTCESSIFEYAAQNKNNKAFLKKLLSYLEFPLGDKNFLHGAMCVAIIHRNFYALNSMIIHGAAYDQASIMQYYSENLGANPLSMLKTHMDDFEEQRRLGVDFDKDEEDTIKNSTEEISAEPKRFSWGSLLKNLFPFWHSANNEKTEDSKPLLDKTKIKVY